MIRDTSRTILHTATMLGMLVLGIWTSPATAQLAPWQQPPGSDRSNWSNPPHADPPPEGEGISDRLSQTPNLDTPDYSSTPWSGEDFEQEGTALGCRPGYLSNLFCDSVHDRFWLRGEFLGWWTKGFATPPLLTTSPTGTPQSQAGVLGAPGTSVLFGGKDLSGGFLPGERLSFGAWLNGGQTLGAEASNLQLNRQTQFFNISSATTPILAQALL